MDFQVEGVFIFYLGTDQYSLSHLPNEASERVLNGMTEMKAPHLPSPWSSEEWATCFVVSDAAGQPLAYVYFSDEPARRAAAKLLTRHDARHVAQHIAQLPSLQHAAELQRSGGLKAKERERLISHP